MAAVLSQDVDAAEGVDGCVKRSADGFAAGDEDFRIDKIEFIDAANPHTYVKLVLLNGDEVDILDYSKIVRSK